MLNVNPLSPAQLKQFADEGFCFTGPVMDDATLAAFRAEELRLRELNLKRNPSAANEMTVFISQVANHSEIVRNYATRGPHLPLMNQLIGPNVIFWFNQFVTKFPDANSGKSEFAWHQDNGYVSIVPPTNVTIWIALDDVDVRNGCVWVMPGSHKKGLLPHATKPGTWHLTLPVEGEGVPAILKAGESVAFTGITLHRSKLNHTDKPRRAFFMEYADAAAAYGPERTPVVKSPDAWIVSGQIPMV